MQNVGVAMFMKNALLKLFKQLGKLAVKTT